MCTIADGITFAFGVLLIPLMEEFQAVRSEISWAQSLLVLFYSTSCTVSGLLVKKFDCRKVCILGASLGALGFGLSALAGNKWVFIFLYGVVGGMGLGTMYVPSIVVVSQYFKAKRGLATGQSNMVSVLIINFAIFHWV